MKRMLNEFLQLESSGGLVLMAATALALICANLPGVSGLYNELLHLEFEARIEVLLQGHAGQSMFLPFVEKLLGELWRSISRRCQ